MAAETGREILLVIAAVVVAAFIANAVGLGGMQ
jgi:hypothetical protein